VLADRRLRTQFLVLGGVSGDLLRQGAETLAGRITFHEPPPLTLAEARLEGTFVCAHVASVPRQHRHAAGQGAQSARPAPRPVAQIGPPPTHVVPLDAC